MHDLPHYFRFSTTGFAVVVTHVSLSPIPGPPDGHPLTVIGPFADRDAAQAEADYWNQVREPGGDGHARVWQMWLPRQQ
jgi:hypothetical protein